MKTPSKARSRYIKRIDGIPWVEQSGTPFQIACCDCGLVHTMVLVSGPKGTPIEIAAKRDPRSTGQRRRHLSKNISTP